MSIFHETNAWLVHEADIFNTLHISLTDFSKLFKLCVYVRGLCGGLVDFLSVPFFLYSSAL